MNPADTLAPLALHVLLVLILLWLLVELVGARRRQARRTDAWRVALAALARLHERTAAGPADPPPR